MMDGHYNDAGRRGADSPSESYAPNFSSPPLSPMNDGGHTAGPLSSNSRSGFFNSPVPRDNSRSNLSAMKESGVRSPVPVRRAEKFKPKLPVAGDYRVRVLIVDEAFGHDTAGRRAVQLLKQHLEKQNIDVITTNSNKDAINIVLKDASVHSVLFDWTMEHPDYEREKFMRQVRKARGEEIPIFVMVETQEDEDFSEEAYDMMDETVYILDDTTDEIAGRIISLTNRYVQTLIPPMAGSMYTYLQTSEYSWAAPGHQGGVAFMKTPAGRIFFDHFNENLFRSDTGIERTQLGSLLDHMGAIGKSEEYAAQVFGAHRTYSGVVGTSGSNRSVFTACVIEGDIALCDRNCHKSIEQGLTLTGGIPVYLMPIRNHYGIIGPIPGSALTTEAIKNAIASSPLVQQKKKQDERAVYAVVTNCTYDGLCYDAENVQHLLNDSVDRIHFDEAWYAYARFNPLYNGRHAMRGDPAKHNKSSDPTVFATHSTHKLLAALSQSSYIHVRDGRSPIPHIVFNESYMMYATTSPLYAIIASNDTATAMMDGPIGTALTQESIVEAVQFRQKLARIARENEAKGSWFFRPWNAPEVTVPGTGETVAFEDAPLDLLVTDPSCWILRDGEAWHGFKGLSDGYCMLDPIKVGIVSPGLNDDGSFDESGIPGPLVNAYLESYGTVAARTTDFQILVMFSVGVTKGKWNTLISTLLSFKRDYDNNKPISKCLPDIYNENKVRYDSMGLRDLAHEMFDCLKESNRSALLSKAFGTLPKPEMTPREAFQFRNSPDLEALSLDEAADCVVAHGIIPYPPGIPLLMPGENIGPADGPYILYLKSLEEWDEDFPGFETITEGAESIDGKMHIYAFPKNSKVH